MSEKKASVHWEGGGKAGQGQISTETEALQKYPYGFASRFGDDRKGTNPEEILGAAHAACFTMAFSFAADKAGIAGRRQADAADRPVHRRGAGRRRPMAVDRHRVSLSSAGRSCPPTARRGGNAVPCRERIG